MEKIALQQCSYGVYIICSKKDSKLNGQIANTVFQVTSDPPTICISINKQNLTHEFIEDSKLFTVSILSKEATMPFIGQFGFKSGRDIDKLQGVKYKIGVTGAPVVLDYAIAYLEAEVMGSMDVSTHTIFVGKVIDSAVIGKGEPMTYEYYHQIKGGKSPKTAPTYVKEEPEGPKKEESGAAKAAKYVCKVCGYVYDPAQGDSGSDIKPGTPFEDLPDTWVCPICAAPKSEFEQEG